MTKIRELAFRNLSQAALLHEIVERSPAAIVYRDYPVAFLIPWPKNEEDWGKMVEDALEYWTQENESVKANEGKKAERALKAQEDDDDDEPMETPEVRVIWKMANRP
jgi:hypothetical protein